MDLTNFPYRSEPRITANFFIPGGETEFEAEAAHLNRFDIDVPDAPAIESVNEPAPEPDESPSIVGDRDFENDPRYKFDDGRLSATDLLGTTVEKVFDGQLCIGSVTDLNIDSETNEAIIHVLYEDGDEEDLTFEEYKAIRTPEAFAGLC